MPDSIRLSGGCHCGAVRFEIDAPRTVTVLDCNCSICSKTGFLHLIVPQPDFHLLTDAAALTRYIFGTHTAQHLFCTTCGIKSFYRPRSHPDGWSVNLRALDDVSALTVTIHPYDGRANWEAARAALPPDNPSS